MDKISKQELIEFLTENLKIEVETETHYRTSCNHDGVLYDSYTVKKIILKLETTEISTDWFE